MPGQTPKGQYLGWQHITKILDIESKNILNLITENYIVIVTGFQGMDKFGNITTLGRGGSDTTAVALQAGLNADACYIFSDVDGIYSAQDFGSLKPAPRPFLQIAKDLQVEPCNCFVVGLSCDCDCNSRDKCCC